MEISKLQLASRTVFILNAVDKSNMGTWRPFACRFHKGLTHDL